MRYTATALSPLHVGRGEVLTPLDFVVLRDAMVVYDVPAFLAENPARETAWQAAVSAGAPDAVSQSAGGADGPTLDALLSSAEQAAAKYHRYGVPAPEFVRVRLKGQGPADRPVEKPSARPSAPAQPAQKKDLRGGLGGKIQLSLTNLPPAPPTAAAAPANAASRAPATPAKPVPPKPERPAPPEKLVGAFLKSPAGNGVYLPGSSVKGALRTALLYQLTQEHPNLAHRLAGDLQRRMFDRSFSSRSADEELAGFLSPNREGVRFDGLSAVTVGDSEPVAPADCLAVDMVRFYSPRTDADGNPVAPAGRSAPPGRGGLGGGLGGGFGTRPERPLSSFRGPPVYLETVRPRTRFAGRFNVNEHLFHGTAARVLQWPGHLPSVTPALLCRAANSLARRVLEREYAYYRHAGGDFAKVDEFYRDLSARIDRADEKTAYLSIGYGAGWHRITVGLALEDMQRLDFTELRRKFALAPHRLSARFPKTRRLVMDSFFTPRAPMGWVELKLE